MQAKFEFRGTGGDLFKSLLKGWLLTGITFGIYLPWFIVDLHKLILGRTKMRLDEEEIALKYTGTGGELFKKIFLGYLLTGVTLGIYLPWFLVSLINFQQNNMTALRADGRTYRLHSKLTGGDLLKTFLLGWLLVCVTFGIYLPWFMCNLQRMIASRMTVRESGEVVATVAFQGRGGELFKTFIVGYLLTMVTFGIYFFWFQVKLVQFFAKSTEVRAGEDVFRGDFTGTGGENFKVVFVGQLLTMITFGIYGFWFLADLLRFQLNHSRFVSGEGASSDETLDREPAALPPPVPARRPAAAAPIVVGTPAKGGAFAVSPAKLASNPVMAERAESWSAVPVRGGSTPELPARIETDAGDRRAAWARAFLTEEAPVEAAHEPIAAQPAPIAAPQPRRETQPPRALPPRAPSRKPAEHQAPTLIADLVPAGPALETVPDIHQTIVQPMHFAEIEDRTDKLSAHDPGVTLPS